jgi:hypothetical protein
MALHLFPVLHIIAISKRSCFALDRVDYLGHGRMLHEAFTSPMAKFLSPGST